MATDYFSNLLGSENDDVVPLSIHEIQQLHPFRCEASMSFYLCSISSVEDIKNTVFILPKNKTPGPDGFSSEFFCSSWSVVGPDLISAVQDFFRNPSMPHQLNATVIALVPKSPGVAKLSDFRPISLCNTGYKVISKILSERLKCITPLAVQRNHVDFVKGRQLCENILLAAELVDDFNKPGQLTQGCLQIDITKAYDNVDWRFLLNILKALELPEVFVEWIRLCYMTPYYSVCLNGELVGFFPGKKGLRQGDSLSSSLFVLVMDILSKKLDQAALANHFSLHPRCSSPLITHLSFTDDMLIFFDGSESSLAAILQSLTEFHHVSGLGLSLSKSCLFVDGGNLVFAQSLAGRFGLTHGSLPIRYLGLPLMPNKLKAPDYQPLLDKFRSRINSWTVKRLSFPGRLQLLQSVLYGIFIFWASVFPLPKACTDSLERMCNAFLWNGTQDSAQGAKVSWVSVCTPKKSGGLGLRRMADSNQVYGLKLIWLLFAANGSLWVAWVQEHLIGSRVFWDTDFQNIGSWIWRSLMKLRSTARAFLVCNVRFGTRALFWHDNWTGLGPLFDICGGSGPMVSGISYSATVSEATTSDGWRLPRGRHPLNQFLRASLAGVSSTMDSSVQDFFQWRHSLDSIHGVFSSTKTWESLYPSPPPVPWFKSVWFSSNIPKHAFLAWIATLNRLPTRDRLLGWGMNVPSVCLLCSNADESRSHVFFHCSISREVWTSFFAYQSLNPPLSFDGSLNWVLQASPNKRVKLVCKLLLHAVCYTQMNLRLHNSSSRSVHLLIRDGQMVMKAKIIGIDRSTSQIQRSTRPQISQESYLSVWFQYFQS
ncbi:hypothetical protein Bca101_004587 [Brassica carinata]